MARSARDGDTPLVSGIDHVAVVVRNAEEAARFYVEQLGLVTTPPEEIVDMSVRLLHIALPHVTIQLVQPTGPGPVEDFLAASGGGLHHICFRTGSISRVLESLPGEADAPRFRGGQGRPACFLLAQPNNVRIELIEFEAGLRVDGDRGRARTAVVGHHDVRSR